MDEATASPGSSAGGYVHRPLCPEGRAIPQIEADAPCPREARPFVLAAMIVASAMAFIDGSVVTIALPVLRADLGAGFSALQWVVNAYALLLGGLILVGGAAGDRFGRRRVFMLGVVVFASASIVCALAPSMSFLIAARGVQGVGAALLVPQSLAIIAASFPKKVRGRAIGIWAGASAITTAMGPPVGGFLIDALDWRVVFWINVPLSLVALGLAARFVPESRNETLSGPLDWGGGALAIAAFGALTVGLTLSTEAQASRLAWSALIALGALGVAAFTAVEARAANPLTPLSLFRARAFTAANVVTLFVYGALSGILFLLPFDLMARRGMSATEVGLTMLPIGLIIGVGSRVSGAVADRYGPRLLLAAGSALVAIAAAGLAWGEETVWLGVVAPVTVLSLGMALVAAPLTTAVMNAVDDRHAGAASGVNNAASRLAGLFAVAILGALASSVFAAELDATALAGGEARFGVLPARGEPARAAIETAFASAYAAALWAAALWSAVAAVIALAFLKPGPRSPDERS